MEFIGIFFLVVARILKFSIFNDGNGFIIKEWNALVGGVRLVFSSFIQVKAFRFFSGIIARFSYIKVYLVIS